MKLKCVLTMESTAVKKCLGRDMTDEEFAAFCKEAVITKMLEGMITNVDKKK